MKTNGFRRVAGRFRLLSRKDGTQFSGVGKPLPSVRVIEDGPVHAVVEALFGYGRSRVCQRYKLPRQGTEIGIETRVFWNEKDRMLKLSIPTPDSGSRYRGQVAFGSDWLRSDGTEVVAQKWVAAVSKTSGTALTLINDGVYGSDFKNGEIRLSLLRSPAYSAHPMGDLPIVPQDRFTPRIDQGEHVFRFWLNGAPEGPRLRAVDREAMTRNEQPMALSFFPPGRGRAPKPFMTLSDTVTQVVAVKKAERGNALIVRLFEPTGRRRSTTLTFPFVRMSRKIRLGPFEVRTIRIDFRKKRWTDVDLMERSGQVDSAVAGRTS